MDISWIENSPYLVAFITGLVGGVHCVGMCGGIVGMLSLGQQPITQKPSLLQHLSLLLGYNFGRIVGYISAGGIVGALGATLLSLTDLNQTKQILSIIAASTC
jgi:sulfite exporter TauE/SafE